MAWMLPENYTTRPIVVLGGGVLGRRIAAGFVAAGWAVRIRDPSSKSREDAVTYIKENISSFLALSHGHTGTYEAIEDLAAAVKNAWLVIEAVPEILAIKESTFADLEKLAPSDAILATNSSSYKSGDLLGKVSEATKRRVLNMHYMMPPQAIIVELMTSGHTDDAIFPFLVQELKKCGLHPVVAKAESSGFIFNRIWAAIKREVLAVIAEGVADAATIDAIWSEQYQSPIGPCTLMGYTLTVAADGVGLDTVEHIETHYVKERNLPSDTVNWLHKNFIETGKLGSKSGNGGLYPAPKSGDRVKIIVLNINPGDYPGQKSPAQTFSSGEILEIAIDDKLSRPVALVPNLKLPDGINICDGRMYWTNMGIPTSNDGHVQSANLDGSDIQTVVPVGKTHTPKQLHIDVPSKKIYFCDREGLRVHRVNLDGSDHEIIVETGNWEKEPDKAANPHFWPVGVTVSNKLRKVFWTQKGASKGNDGRIFAAPIDLPAGTDPAARNDIETIAINLPECIDLEMDDESGFLYWTDRGEIPLGNTLNKKQLIGPAPATEGKAGHQIIAQGFAEAIGLALDKQKQCIYVSEIGGRLWQCELEPAPKKKLFESQSTAFTGLTFLRY